MTHIQGFPIPPKAGRLACPQEAPLQNRGKKVLTKTKADRIYIIYPEPRFGKVRGLPIKISFFLGMMLGLAIKMLEQLRCLHPTSGVPGFDNKFTSDQLPSHADPGRQQ